MDEIFATLLLYRSENIGPVSFRFLINKFGSAIEVLKNIPDLEDKWKKKINLIDKYKVEEEIEKTVKFGAKFVLIKDNIFFNFLRNTIDSPPILTIYGNVPEAKTISIVGTRNPSGNGILFTRQICKEINNIKLITVSGMAIGIDTEVHNSSECTVAVLAGGINDIYPYINKVLYEKIKEKGIIISDRPFDSKASRFLFPKRNLIIAGLSEITCVIESTKNSGALITAEHARKYGRQVLAVPGHPMDPRYEGNNYLIKSGAKILCSFGDILENINKIMLEYREIMACITPEDRKKILSKLSFSPLSINNLVNLSDCSVESVLSLLAELEILGTIKITENLDVVLLKN